MPENRRPGAGFPGGAVAIASPPDPPRHRLPVHPFEPDTDGIYCVHTKCGMLRPHANHRVPGYTPAVQLVLADLDGPAEAPTPPDERSLFVNVASLLAGGLPTAPPPVLLHREDGHALFYGGKVNVLFGDPECGKTWIALAAIVEALDRRVRAAVFDLDHNGAAEIIGRLLALGANPKVLADPTRFLLAEPEDASELAQAVTAVRGWRAGVVIVDSVGEVLPLLDLSSSSPDDYTKANRYVLTPLATAGAAVIAIDHLPKSDEARARGQTGTTAKRRTINGVSLRVTLHEAFVPGRGGSASMTVDKDRAGQVRRHCPDSDKNPPAGRFVMTPRDDGTLSWKVTAPRVASTPEPLVPDDDVAELDALVPPPQSRRDVEYRMKWGAHRAGNALKKWRELRKPDV